MKRIVPIVKGCLVVVLLASLALAAQAKRERQTGIRSYKEAREVARSLPSWDARKPLAAASSSAPEEELPLDPVERLAQINLAALQEINPDVIGWIEIPDTELSYPIVQGKDNQYYLNRTWDKKRSSAGSVFMDCNSSAALDQFHAILYGHRMTDQSMFGTLRNYRDPDFWPEHPSLYVATAAGVYRYDIFSAQEADITGVVYRLDIEESGLEEEFVQYCTDNAVVNTALELTAEDRFLTLSTCTGYGHATRWVVHGVLGETYERSAADPAE